MSTAPREAATLGAIIALGALLRLVHLDPDFPGIVGLTHPRIRRDYEDAVTGWRLVAEEDRHLRETDLK